MQQKELIQFIVQLLNGRKLLGWYTCTCNYGSSITSCMHVHVHCISRCISCCFPLPPRRVRALEEEVRGVQEKAAQLQVEKEKALSDLNNIRKINRNMEK